MFLKLDNVSASIGGFNAIRNINIEVPKGDFVSILGNNGAGKTSLFRTIAGVIKPTKGEIYFKDKRIDNMPTIKIVSQGLCLCPEGRQLFPRLSVYKNLILGAYTSIHDKAGVEESLSKVYEFFPRLKERSNQLAGTLSGGEQQMVAIGRAIMAKPDLLMLDEPSMGLAPLVVEMIAEVITEINKSGTTVLLSEQNANVALHITRYAYVLEEGKVVLEGLSQDLLNEERVKKAYLGA